MQGLVTRLCRGKKSLERTHKGQSDLVYAWPTFKFGQRLVARTLHERGQGKRPVETSPFNKKTIGSYLDRHCADLNGT